MRLQEWECHPCPISRHPTDWLWFPEACDLPRVPQPEPAGRLGASPTEPLAHLAWLLVYTHSRVAGAATKVGSAWVVGQTHFAVTMVVLGAATLSMSLRTHRAMGDRGTR